MPLEKVMINIFEPNVCKDSEKLLEEVFESRWLGKGKLTNKFEADLCEYLKVQRSEFHTIASCTDALFASIRVFNLPRGSCVVIPSNSFPALPSAIIEAGLSPIIVDIDPTTGNLCLDELQKYYDTSCSAVFVTDYGGIPNDIKAIRNIVGENSVVFVDAAPSLGTFAQGKFSGQDADFCCWSFDAMKLLTCGEGGGVYIKDAQIMERFREYTYLGLSASEKSGLDRSKGGNVWWEYHIKSPGRRSIFTDINAAIGLPQIGKLEQRISRRSEIRSIYEDAFKDLDWLSYIEQGDTAVRYSNYFFTVITEHRDELAMHLKNNGIYSTFRYYPLHRIPIFQKYSMECKKCEIFSDQALNIPIHDSLSNDDVKDIIYQIKNFCSLSLGNEL